jgi:hypothetical protein
MFFAVPASGLAMVIIFFFLDLHTPKTPLVAGLKAIDWLGTLLDITRVAPYAKSVVIQVVFLSLGELSCSSLAFNLAVWCFPGHPPRLSAWLYLDS